MSSNSWCWRLLPPCSHPSVSETWAIRGTGGSVCWKTVLFWADGTGPTPFDREVSLVRVLLCGWELGLLSGFVFGFKAKPVRGSMKDLIFVVGSIQTTGCLGLPVCAGNCALDDCFDARLEGRAGASSTSSKGFRKRLPE